jgi:hypothetical protein
LNGSDGIPSIFERSAAFLDAIREPLCRAGLASPADDLSLLPRPRNPLRLDYQSRFDFRLLRGKQVLCHVTVGRDLGELRTRMEDFASACPDIACRPLFWHVGQGWHFLGSEYFAAVNIAAAGQPGSPPVDPAAALDRVEKALASSEQSSSADALIEELQALWTEVFSLSLFGRLDRLYLQSVVFPFLEEASLSQVPATRWTNGDFVAGNVLVDAAGECRLVDCEFARRTHLFAIDRWRWDRLSGGAPSLRVLRPQMPETPAWVAALGLLQHICFLHRILPATVAVGDARLCAEELLKVVARAHAGFRGDILFRPPSEPSAPQAPVAPPITAQLFWSADGSYSESSAQTTSYSAETETCLRFNIAAFAGVLRLRFDPADRAGLLEISSIRIAHTRQLVVAAWNEITGWSGLAVNHEALRLADSPKLNVLALDTDPFIEFPPIELGSDPGPVLCEIWIRYSARLSTVPPLLPGATLPAVIKEANRRIAELVESLHAQNATLLEYAQRSQIAATEHQRMQAEIDRLTRLRQETEAQLQALQARLAGLEKRPLVRLDDFLRGHSPASSPARVL